MMKVKETFYDGYKFRSRLEARWAVFFKTLGIKYEYEKEGFDLDGISYLPDFWLPEQKCWIEIKGKDPTEEEMGKAHKLAEYSGYTVYIFFGDIEIPGGHGNVDTDGGYLCDPYSSDSFQRWCECPKCGKLGIHFEGRAYRLPCNCFDEDKDGSCYNASSERLISAYRTAKQARFEHGEKGNS